jgi:hypothetical protein
MKTLDDLIVAAGFTKIDPAAFGAAVRKQPGMADCDDRKLARLRKGVVDRPEPALLTALAATLDVPVEQLIGVLK